jgi:hypothetical protein
MHCNNYRPLPLSRRELLQSAANGFGAVALAALLGEEAQSQSATNSKSSDPLAPRAPHFKARATSVIFLFMDGGPSQVDTFDPKPLLIKEHGQPFKGLIQASQFNNPGNVLKSPWEFRPYGKSGIPVSDLFPNVGQCVDDMTIIRSMVSDHPEHTNANFFMHSGSGMQGRPSMGAWTTYGLGSACRNLPGFVVLNSGMIPPGGVDNFTNGFLPASFQGSLFRDGASPLSNLQRTEPTVQAQQAKIALMRQLDQDGLHRQATNIKTDVKIDVKIDDKIEAAIANYELAFQMQAAVPDLMDMKGETEATRRLYGLDNPKTQTYGQQCLVARRLVERGVRFIEVLCPNTGGDRWDQHSNLLQGHTNNALAIDKPIAGLLKDLKSRGLLDTTLVVWAGEFGRTPIAQGSDGRDHNPSGFSIWMAGGGVKGGAVYGATDEYGYNAIENRVTVHDLHATMLHLLGLDHKRLTYRFSGRDMRLTDVYGEIVHDILA